MIFPKYILQVKDCKPNVLYQTATFYEIIIDINATECGILECLHDSATTIYIRYT